MGGLKKTQFSKIQQTNLQRL